MNKTISLDESYEEGASMSAIKEKYIKYLHLFLSERQTYTVRWQKTADLYHSSSLSSGFDRDLSETAKPVPKSHEYIW